MLEIQPCDTASAFFLAVKLTRDYLRWLDLDLSFQDIDTELSRFDEIYGPPGGVFLLAWRNAMLAGGVGLRRLEPDICEMKRLFVYEAFQKKGVGRRLCTALIEYAEAMGYRKMRLDTLGRMKAARQLYQRLGFKEIRPYRFNPDPAATFMELDL